MIFSKGLVIIINIVCFCFVAWKSIECFVKYSKDPKGTNVGVEYAGHQKMFPTITICGPPPKTDNKSTRWNQTYLHQCGISGYIRNSLKVMGPIIYFYIDNFSCTGLDPGEMGNGFQKTVQIQSYFLNI